MASAGSLKYKVLLGSKGSPSIPVARHILGSSCARLEEALKTARREDLLVREYYIEGRCAHPSLIPQEKILLIPEPGAGGSPCPRDAFVPP
jgi:hypothetical protein